MKDMFSSPYVRDKYKTLGKVPPHLHQVGDNFVQCPNCGLPLFKKKLLRQFFVCSSCQHHLRMDAKRRIRFLFDEGSFQEYFKEITSGDPLEFKTKDLVYTEKIKDAKNKHGIGDAVICGTATLRKIPVAVAVMDFFFMGGSMGSAVGEKIYQTICLACEKGIPLIIVSASGGARMQEGILSLMQMAKTCSALGLLREKKVPYISMLTDPTTGGVSASFSLLGDINIAEPGALIGFAGPRVIEQAIGQKLPKGFQSAEYLKDHGFLDMVVSRQDIHDVLFKILNFFTSHSETRG